MANQPHIRVGILSAPHIEIELLEAYTMGATEVRGKRTHVSESVAPHSEDVSPSADEHGVIAEI